MKENKNIRLQPVLLMMAILALILAGILMYTGYETRTSYNEMQEATERYITCQASAQAMQNGSDNLTKYAQAYTATGNIKELNRYFEEADVIRSRDNALQSMEEYFAGTPAYEALENALARSNRLMEREYYAMRLMADAMEEPDSLLPEEIRQVELSEEDKALSSEEKRDLAREIMFGTEYEVTKNTVSEAVTRCMNELQTSTREDQLANSAQVIRFLNLSYALVAALLLIVFATFLLTTLLALRPLWRAISRIQEKELIPEAGSYEVQYLARTYNHMFEKNRMHQDKLSYEATHDALTKLYNRGVFEEMLPSCEFQENALILLDLDHFKQMNDQYGHQTGDLVLQKLSKALQESFRGEDYVCRIGGDEFAVLMVNVGKEMTDLVENKLALIRDKVSVKDGVPPFTLSIGVAFSEEGLTGTDVYSHADAALYKAKENGRNGHAFYEE